MKKKIIYILISFILSFIGSILFEVIIINHETIGKKSDYNPKIIETKDVKKDKGYYVTTSKDSYIKIKANSNYINKISFNYKYSKDFSWNYSYEENGEEVKIGATSSSFMNKTIKKVNKNTNTIKISFMNKNVKIKNISIDNSIFIYWYRVIALTIVLTIIMSLLILRKDLKKFKIENIFLVLALSFGLAFIIVSPKHIYTGFDDQVHFAHVLNPFRLEKSNYSYAEQITVSGALVRDNTYITTKEEKIEFYKTLNNIHKKTKNRKATIVNDRRVFGNLIYLPFTIGYKLANLLNFSFTTCLMISKFFNLLLYSFMMYLAIKYAKYGKKVIFMVGFIPEIMHLASQFSYDPTIVSGLTLATVCYMNIIMSEKLDKKSILLFIICTVWASLPKALYCPFLLLLLFIPNKKFESKKQAIIFKLLITIITGLLMATFVLPTATGQMSADDRGNGASVSGQIKYILNNPISFIVTLFKFNIVYIWKIFSEENILFLPYLADTSKFKILYIIYLVTLLYYVFTSGNKETIKKGNRVLLSLEVIGIWLLFCVALYLKFTKVGLNTIKGMQPRYIDPLFVSLFYIFMFRKHEKNNDYLYIIVPTIYLIAIIGLLAIKVA